MSELRIVEDWSDPETRGHTIPGARYTSKEFFEQEWEGMWTKVWLLLGREAEIPNHGDWQMEEVGPEEILMVRQKDGGVKASIKDKLDGSKGLKGATISTKKEQKKIIIKIMLDIIAVGDFVKLK